MSTDNYLDLLNKFEEAKSALTKIADGMQKAAHDLRYKPDEFIPQSIEYAGSLEAKLLANAIQKYRDAKRAALDAWNLIPADRQGKLKSPNGQIVL